MVARKPGRQGDHEVSRKTIAQEMPGVPGSPVVTTPRVIYTTRDCGCTAHPAFPAPSFLFGADDWQTSDTSCREIAEMRLQRILRDASLRDAPQDEVGNGVGEDVSAMETSW
jgi:hypothetical protein